MEAAERRVIEAIKGAEHELVMLLSDLVAFDTTARTAGEQARDESALQEYLAVRLRRAGAVDIDLFEPRRGDLPERADLDLDFRARPQLVATFRGLGGGRSLLLSGHVDVVTPEPVERWTSDPWRATVRDRKVYGRGACDAKGAIAAAVFAAEVLARMGVELSGDLIVNTVTDSESTGAGALACVAHGIAAEAGICLEPSGDRVLVAARGNLRATIRVEGRPGDAQLSQAHWQEGGAVNAIEKASVVIAGLPGLRDEWRQRSDPRPALLPAPAIVPTLIAGGEWAASYPTSCEIVCDILYPPGDGDGDAEAVEADVREWLAGAAGVDPWLRANPPTIAFERQVEPFSVPLEHPLVALLCGAASDLLQPTEPGGSDGRTDASTYTRRGATPTVGFGPGSPSVAHTIDEHVAIDELIAATQAIALTAMRWCGTARS